MSYYQRHVFVCENRRDSGKKMLCGRAAAAVCDNPVKFLRTCLKAQQAHGKGKVRINRAGCFDRCPLGPVLVVYPDNIWYRYESTDDLGEIAQKHLIGGKAVRRLRLPNKA